MLHVVVLYCDCKCYNIIINNGDWFFVMRHAFAWRQKKEDAPCQSIWLLSKGRDSTKSRQRAERVLTATQFHQGDQYQMKSVRFYSCQSRNKWLHQNLNECIQCSVSTHNSLKSVGKMSVFWKIEVFEGSKVSRILIMMVPEVLNIQCWSTSTRWLQILTYMQLFSIWTPIYFLISSVIAVILSFLTKVLLISYIKN